VKDEIGSHSNFESAEEKLSLHEYYKYQKINALGPDSMHKLIIGDIKTTMIR